jgi:hypothetical protein
LVGAGFAAEAPGRAAERTGTDANATPPKLPRFALRAEKWWQLNLPSADEFEASGLLLLPDGGLLTISDHGPELYRVKFLEDTNAADLVRLPDCFSEEQLAPFTAQKTGHYDCEGIARDSQGRLYVCEEMDRWILRFDPKLKAVERLDVDWSSVRKYFHPTERNASFEGVAIGDGKLYVANERQLGRIIVVDLDTLKVVEDFVVRPSTSQARDIHYSDLSWFDGSLFVLLRESHVVLRVDPATKKVLAEYDFGELERQPEVIYRNPYPTSLMEGLAVDRDFIWLVTDNNGRPRARHPNDTRPTLFKCPRPDK